MSDKAAEGTTTFTTWRGTTPHCSFKRRATYETFPGSLVHGKLLNITRVSVYYTLQLTRCCMRSYMHYSPKCISITGEAVWTQISKSVGLDINQTINWQFAGLKSVWCPTEPMCVREASNTRPTQDCKNTNNRGCLLHNEHDKHV